MADQHADAGDRITLTLPANTAYAALGRTATLAAGTRADLPTTTLAALALAVDETMVLLLGAAHGDPDATVVVGLGVHDRRMSVDITCTGAGAALVGDTAAVERFGLLVDGTVEHWSVDPATGTVHLDITG
jgi:hypothetical protein